MHGTNRPAAEPGRWENPRIAELLDKKIVFVTGKGGVGKTTVSLALGLAAAAAGRRTIVCEVSSQEYTSRVFGRAEIGFRETELRPNLFAISIDPDDAMREYLELQLPVKAMSDLLYKSKIFSYLAAATPGLREMVTIGKIWELALERRKTKRAEPYDLVIVDAPATGHGLGLLQTPQNFKEIARAGPMANQAGAIQKTIVDPEVTGAVIVALPEEMPVNESAQLETELRDSVGVAIDRIYMNALYPERFDDDSVDAIAAAIAASSPTGAPLAALEAARDQAGRARSQRGQLDRLEQLTQTSVDVLPFIFAPTLGVAELRQLAEQV